MWLPNYFMSMFCKVMCNYFECVDRLMRLCLFTNVTRSLHSPADSVISILSESLHPHAMVFLSAHCFTPLCFWPACPSYSELCEDIATQCAVRLGRICLLWCCSNGHNLKLYVTVSQWTWINILLMWVRWVCALLLIPAGVLIWLLFFL